MNKHMKPLSKKARMISLVITLALFVILGPIILAYSVGYRFDSLTDNFSWVRTGGIYVHSNISNTEVFLDGEFVKNNGLLVRNTFIQNLHVDENHIVEVHKDGYYSWRKELPVVESFVTEARVMMLPEEIEKFPTMPFVDINGVGTTTDDSRTIFNENYLDLQVLFGLASSTESISESISKSIDVISNGIDGRIEIVDDTDSVREKVSDVSDIPEYYIELGIEDPEELENLIVNNEEVSWLQDGNVVINWIGSESEIPYYYCDFDECQKTIELDWELDISRFNFLPGRNDIFAVLNEKGLWAVEVDNRSGRNIQPIYLGENIDFRINANNRITVLDENIFYELRF